MPTKDAACTMHLTITANLVTNAGIIITPPANNTCKTALSSGTYKGLAKSEILVLVATPITPLTRLPTSMDTDPRDSITENDHSRTEYCDGEREIPNISL